MPRSCSIVIGAATLSQSTAPSRLGAAIGPCGCCCSSLSLIVRPRASTPSADRRAPRFLRDRASVSTGHGTRHVQFTSSTTAGVLMRSVQPNTSCSGISVRHEPADSSDCRIAAAALRSRPSGVAASGSMSCVPVVATERSGNSGGSIGGCPSRSQCRSQRSTFSPGRSRRAIDSRTNGGIDPRSSAITSGC